MGSQERVCFVGAFGQHLAFGRISCLQRFRKSVNILLVPLCSIWLFGDAASLQRVRKSVNVSLTLLWALGMKSCLQRVRESVNVLLVLCLCAASGSGDEILSAEGSQERGCLVSAFAQPRVVAE